MRAARAGARARAVAVALLVAAVGARCWRCGWSRARRPTRWSGGSDAYQATERYRQSFGDHAVVVLVRGRAANLVLTDEPRRGCSASRAASPATSPGQARRAAPRSPCAAFARTKPVQVVYGPGTFINSAVNEINEQLAAQLGNTQQQAARAKQAARKLAKASGKSKAEQDKAAAPAEQLVYAQFMRDLLQINLRYGLGLDGSCRGSTTRTSSPRSSSTRRAARRRRRRASPTCSRTRRRRSSRCGSSRT